MEIDDYFDQGDESELNQSQFLAPMRALSPPNSLITKKYQPDVSPTIRLIIQKDIKKVPAMPSQIPQIDEIKEYLQLFKQEDYLGHHFLQQGYAPVYVKWDNRGHNLLRLTDTRCRFLTGVFVTSDKIKQAAQKTEDVYSFFRQSSSSQNGLLQPFFSSSNPSHVRFSSNFESGNLFAAFKVGQFEYDCVMQSDTNSRGSTQWFYFNTELTEQTVYTFNILNFTKSNSLYEKGMHIVAMNGKPYEASYKAGQGWFRTGININYSSTDIRRQTRCSSQIYYQLSFSYKAKQKNQSITFAATYPYSLLDSEKFFNRITFKKVGHSIKVKKIEICKSACGIPIYIYSVICRNMRHSLEIRTLQNDSHSKYQLSLLNRRQTINNFKTNDIDQRAKAVILIGRQHPGQPQSSYLIQGMVQFLYQNSEFDSIKKEFVFYFIPVLNTDGIKYGNYRSNLSGSDLNRVWRQPHRQLHPQIVNTKKLLFQINKNTPISLILDIHGHSRSLNTFFYGNPRRKESIDDPKLFPFLCSKRIKQVSFQQCTFSIKQDKKNSARVVLSEMFPKSLVYTLQNSFYGWQLSRNDENTIIQYTPDSLRKLGRDILASFLQYARLSQKNPTVKQKWAKQIEAANQGLEGTDSDSENEKQAIMQSSEKDCKKEQKYNNKRSYDDHEKSNQLRTQTKKKLTHLVPSTVVPGTMKISKPQSSKDIEISPMIKQDMKFTSQITRNQSVLSILKINTFKPKVTRTDFVPFNQNNSCSIPNHSLDQHAANNNDARSLMRKDPSERHDKKIRIQDAIKSSLGMKRFLQAMGLNIQKRKNIIRITNLDDIRA